MTTEENGQQQTGAAEGGAQQQPQPSQSASQQSSASPTGDLGARAAALVNDPKSAYWNANHPEHARAVAEVFAARRAASNDPRDHEQLPASVLLRQTSIRLPVQMDDARLDADPEFREFIQFVVDEGVPSHVVTRGLAAAADRAALNGGHLTKQDIVALDAEIGPSLHPETRRRLREWALAKAR